jgi:ATP-dependent helicase/nuclease subunit B
MGLLHLRETGLRRDAVMDWLSAAPVLEERNGRPVPAHAWDTLSRSAGIVGGATQWRERLARHKRSLQEKREALERQDEDGEGRRRRLEIDIDLADRLGRFMDDLMAVDPGRRSTWADFAMWARGLLERYLGGEGHRRLWPDEAIEAHHAIEASLEALSALDDVRRATDEATFRRALERELEAPAGRIGRFGEGVFIGRIADALGTDFDIVFVLGMTEGLTPPRGRDDPLLPDRERSIAEDLPLRMSRAVEARRDYLAALAAAPDRVLVYPRADLRGQRGRLPGRWLTQSASLLEGRTLFSADLDGLQARPWFTNVPSFETALAGVSGPASPQEYDLRGLLRWRRSGRRAIEHYLVTETRALGDGLSSDVERGSTSLTRWDGRLPAGAARIPSADQAVSPTALQNWATCPFRYFLGQVLRIAETEKPEDTLTLSALERGNLLHQALETFIHDAPARTAPDQPWDGEDRSHLTEIGERLCDEAEAAGVAGKPLLWRLERERILRDLAGFLDADERLRAEHGVVPEAVELSFGVSGAELPAVAATLPDGRPVAFRGRIDRVDRAPDGSRVLVLDYKSGSPAPYARLHIDPVQRGTSLQLPIYALAAQQRYGRVAAAAYYWFATERQSYDLKGYDVDESVLARFRDTLAVVIDGIEQGLFPARPGSRRTSGFENCLFCAYDRVCPRDRGRVWERKRLVAELRAYIDLAEPED